MANVVPQKLKNFLFHCCFHLTCYFVNEYAGLTQPDSCIQALRKSSQVSASLLSDIITFSACSKLLLTAVLCTQQAEGPVSCLSLC